MCGEPDVMAYICDSYKREYVIRYAAADAARAAQRDLEDPSQNCGVRFLQGVEITEQEAERLYSRGICRLFNDFRSTCRRRCKSVSYCQDTKTFTSTNAKDCDATVQHSV
jgi:hypothetical protein